MTKKIDGRKAVVTTTGALFSGYSEFANYYDYPESAGQYPETNPNRKLKDGDVVTLLVSGKHLNLLYEYPLWIIESVNGEKYIIGERGLRIIENETEGGDSMDNVTEIDGVKYREVKRKAAVGETVKIVNAGYTLGYYNNGDVKEVVSLIFGDYPKIPIRGGTSDIYLNHSEYVVLEPITVDIAASDDLAASDVDLIVLQRELNGLKRQQAEFAKQIDGLTDAFAKLAAKTAAPQVKTVIPPQVLRDDIVAQAKLDVAELSTTIIPGDVVPTIDGDVEAFFPGDTDYVEFVVNRDKRTVVALIRYIGENDVWAKGITKAAPGDVFNSHIGRAISLRRALGLPVPTEYTNAPQPEGFSKGDVIEWASGSRYKLVNVNHPEYTFYSYAADETFEPLRYLDGLNAAVIDDSDRYESEVSA